MAKRLTMSYKDEVTTYDPIDVQYNDYSQINFQNVLKKLEHYEDLAEQGRLIELPCAVGTPIWYLLSEKNNETCEYEYFYGKCGFELFMFKKLGKKYFLTEEEVLEKLKELRGEQE